jgi:hypothetical protein
LQTLKDVGETPRSVVRQRKPLKKFLHYMALVSSIIYGGPSIFEEATYQQVWKDSMVKEYTSIMMNDVWDIVQRLEGKLVVSSMWLYKITHAMDGIIDKFKVRFVARGFSRKEGVEYKENFSLVTRYASIRAIISIASIMRWRIHQMDVKIAFLNRIIEEKVYIDKP